MIKPDIEEPIEHLHPDNKPGLEPEKDDFTAAKCRELVARMAPFLPTGANADEFANTIIKGLGLK